MLVYEGFGSACHLPLVSCTAYSSTLMTEAICSSETSVDFFLEDSAVMLEQFKPLVEQFFCYSR
jgi:hypothetical protein